MIEAGVISEAVLPSSASFPFPSPAVIVSAPDTVKSPRQTQDTNPLPGDAASGVDIDALLPSTDLVMSTKNDNALLALLLLKNFLTILASSMVAPRDADFEANSDNFPPKSSILSLSFIFNLSNSEFKVCNLASLTRSAPTCRVFIASHTCLADSIYPTTIRKQPSTAKLFFKVRGKASCYGCRYRRWWTSTDRDALQPNS
ncbi:unnamed protein product, partial [Brassica oleracea var. botrytis]